MNVWLLAGFALAACGGSAKPSVPEVLPVAQPSTSNSNAAEPHVFASQFEFASAAQATAELPVRLSVSLAGQAWAQALVQHPTVPAAAIQQSKSGNGVRLSVQLSRPQLEQWLLEFERAPLQAQVPDLWQPQWLSALGSVRAERVCQLKQELLGLPCAESQPDPALAAIQGLPSAVVLEPSLLDGVPTANNTALWPLRVRVMQHAEERLQVLTNVPVRLDLKGPAAPPPVRTDELGYAEFQLPAHSEGGRVVAFDVSELGPLAPYFKEVALELRTRPLDRARCALLLETPAHSTDFERAVASQLHQGAEPSTPSLSPALTRDLLSSADRVLPTHLMHRIVEETQGRLDYVAKVHMTSEFASQMGSGRTWYEARANVKVLEVWSGKTVDLFELYATESGLGDQGADAAAREKLGGLVGVRLRKP